jgi:hypothetical protein
MVTDQGFITGNLLKQNNQLSLSKDNNRRTKGMPRPTVELNRKGQPGKAALVLDPISYEIPRAKVATFPL